MWQYIYIVVGIVGMLVLYRLPLLLSSVLCQVSQLKAAGDCCSCTVVITHSGIASYTFCSRDMLDTVHQCTWPAILP